jgi:hypothetical protein
VLSEKWSLGNVDDVEALVKNVLVAELGKRDVRLRGHDFDDALCFLLEQAWLAWERYDGQRGLTFAAYLRQWTKLRYLDHVRKVRGRTIWQWKDSRYERPARPLNLSLDAAGPDGDGRSLGETLADGSSDPIGGGDSSPLRELLEDRDRDSPWNQAVVRAHARRRFGDGAVRDRKRAA